MRVATGVAAELGARPVPESGVGVITSLDAGVAAALAGDEASVSDVGEVVGLVFVWLGGGVLLAGVVAGAGVRRRAWTCGSTAAVAGFAKLSSQSVR